MQDEYKMVWGLEMAMAVNTMWHQMLPGAESVVSKYTKLVGSNENNVTMQCQEKHLHTGNADFFLPAPSINSYNLLKVCLKSSKKSS